MASTAHTVLSRLIGTVFILALFALIVFFALRFIPAAERPTLAPSPAGSGIATTP